MTADHLRYPIICLDSRAIVLGPRQASPWSARLLLPVLFQIFRHTQRPERPPQNPHPGPGVSVWRVSANLHHATLRQTPHRVLSQNGQTFHMPLLQDDIQVRPHSSRLFKDWFRKSFIFHELFPFGIVKGLTERLKPAVLCKIRHSLNFYSPKRRIEGRKHQKVS